PRRFSRRPSPASTRRRRLPPVPIRLRGPPGSRPLAARLSPPPIHAPRPIEPPTGGRDRLRPVRGGRLPGARSPPPGPPLPPPTPMTAGTPGRTPRAVSPVPRPTCPWAPTAPAESAPEPPGGRDRQPLYVPPVVRT